MERVSFTFKRNQTKLTDSLSVEVSEQLGGMLIQGRGGLMARLRSRDRKIAGSKPDSTDDPPCMGPPLAKSYALAKRPPAGAARKPRDALRYIR
ncbi:hypothetical protein AVEN_191210-1 [Araneus ventricosus]|uniref:Uncharacterized protein n=1 Tax=Araneus ventricosus TaxID=182803 RepID=A0A4Y2TXY2_ARAVE|nr:hypothetical protein AVEN_191210-1 [Araneus ventricosus]